MKRCSICSSDKYVSLMLKDNEYKGSFLCGKHRNRVNRKQSLSKRSRYDSNEINILEDYAEMSLYNNEGETLCKVKIDLEDVETVSEHKWYLEVNGYARSKVGYLHKLLVEYEIVDHINRDRMNNMKSNLREASTFQNAVNAGLRSDNTSGVIGVRWVKADLCWCAKIEFNKKQKYKSGFRNKRDAIVQRLEWEKKHFKEFAPQIHLFEKYGIF